MDSEIFWILKFLVVVWHFLKQLQSYGHAATALLVVRSENQGPKVWALTLHQIPEALWIYHH